MSSIYQRSLDEFRACVDVVRLSDEFLHLARQLRPRLGQFIRWEAVKQTEQPLIQKFLGSEPENEITSQGLVIRLCAAFETFLKQLVRDSVRQLNSKRQKFNDIDPRLVLANRHFSGVVLSRVKYPDGVTVYDYDQICRDLGTCEPKGTPTLIAESFAISVESMSKDAIEGVFDLFQQSLSWDSIAKNVAFDKLRGTQSTRAYAKSIQADIARLQKLRNRFAHSGYIGNELRQNQVSEEAEFLFGLASSISDELERVVLS